MATRQPARLLPETPDLQGAFPRLSDEQIQTLATRGEPRRTRVGDVLIEEGKPCSEFFVILSGKVAVVEGSGPEARIVRVHGPGRFLGELGLLAGQQAFVSCLVAGRVRCSPCRSSSCASWCHMTRHSAISSCGHTWCADRC